jgi:arabinose-5-phosphate isomerase
MMNISKEIEYVETHILAALIAIEKSSHFDIRVMITLTDLIQKSSGKVITSGVGTSGATAKRLAHLLSVTGTPAFYLHPADGLNGAISAVEDNDIYIVISKGGESTDLIRCVEIVKHKKTLTVLLTESPESTLGLLVDQVVTLAKISHPADPAGMIAMTSTLAISLWGDCLCNLLMYRTGYSWDEVLRNHPSGAVGKNGMTDFAKESNQ